MRKRRLPLFLWLILSIGTILYCSLTSFAYIAENEGDETEEVNVEDAIEFATPPGTHELINFDIFEDIARARALLEKTSCGFKVVTPRVTPKKQKKKGKHTKQTRQPKQARLAEFTILLAVENLKTRDIAVVKVHPELGGRSGGIVVEPGKSNGVNTKFTITYPEHHIVLALKRPVRHGETFREVVYTPYSEGIDIPRVREAGLDYLRSVLVSAKRELLGRGVRPRSQKRFIADDVAVTLAIIEHIDPLKFQNGKYTPEQLIHETLVILGANRESAYRFSASKAGARGLFQFIPKTYNRIARLYPEAGLHRDFIRGMEDHANAAKASFLLFDADLRSADNGKKELFESDPRELGRFLASSYNCGAGKTRGAMDRYRENWCSGLPAETRVYLRKFDVVWDWLAMRSARGE